MLKNKRKKKNIVGWHIQWCRATVTALRSEPNSIQNALFLSPSTDYVGKKLNWRLKGKHCDIITDATTVPKACVAGSFKVCLLKKDVIYDSPCCIRNFCPI